MTVKELFCTLFVALSLISGENDFAFNLTYLDLDYGGNGRPGWVRAGDMDNDGDLDIVAGGGNALFIYENDGSTEGWVRYGSLDSTGAMGANGAVLFDVDADGDVDVVSAKYYSELGWWENPDGTLSSVPWSFHKLGDTDWFLHDIERIDLYEDGITNEFLVNLISGGLEADLKIQWFKPEADPLELWRSYTIEPGRNDEANNHAGLDIGDIDQDGDLDLAYSNGWYEAPDTPGGTWAWHQITDIYGVSNSLLRDMDDDGDLDLIMSAGHHGNGVYWFENPQDLKSDMWIQHTIDSTVLHPECLAVQDLDDDGDLDIVTCDLDFEQWSEPVHNIYVFENIGKNLYDCWPKHNIAPDSYPSHLLQVVDVNTDGAFDIISEATGYSVISYYKNGSSVERVGKF